MGPKLTCINKKGWYRLVPFGKYSAKEPVEGPKFFDDVTVVCEHKVAGSVYYDLAEWPGGGPYEARGFTEIDKLPRSGVVIEEELETLSVM